MNGGPRASEHQLFESAFRHAAIGMALVALDGRWLKVNDALCSMLGYAREELLARDSQSITHPDDLAPDLSFVQRLLDGEVDSYYLEKRYVAQHGRVVWGGLTVTLVREAGEPLFFIAQIQDLTPRKQAESEALAFFEYSLDMLAIAGAGSRLTRVNGAWEKALGFTREELTSVPFIEFVHPDDRERTRAEGKAVLSGHGTMGFRNRFRTKSGDYRWVAWSTHPTSEGQLYCVVRDVTEQVRMEEELRRLAVTDPLTGLNNRREFTTIAKREVNRATRYMQELSFLLIDADHFKGINDEYGHAAGDEVLCALAACLQKTLRESDVVARWGGEEFVALLYETGEEAANEAAERIRHACSELVVDSLGHSIRLTVSVGATTLRDGESNFDGMLERADRALYAAKDAGRNCVVFEP